MMRSQQVQLVLEECAIHPERTREVIECGMIVLKAGLNCAASFSTDLPGLGKAIVPCGRAQLYLPRRLVCCVERNVWERRHAHQATRKSEVWGNRVLVHVGGTSGACLNR